MNTQFGGFDTTNYNTSNGFSFQETPPKPKTFSSGFSFAKPTVDNQPSTPPIPPKAPRPTSSIPGKVNITSPNIGFSFMLNPNSGRFMGRKALEKCELNRSEDRCAECAQAATFRCRDCRKNLCEVCIRTIISHVKHEVTALINKQAVMPKASFCNGCGVSPLPIPYYHCMVCEDYDLCGTCEGINDVVVATTIDDRIHDPTHPMVKYRRPRDVGAFILQSNESNS
jgi:hypothetical protein